MKSIQRLNWCALCGMCRCFHQRYIGYTETRCWILIWHAAVLGKFNHQIKYMFPFHKSRWISWANRVCVCVCVTPHGHNHINQQKYGTYAKCQWKFRTNHMNVKRARTGEILTMIYFCWCRTNRTKLKRDLKGNDLQIESSQNDNEVVARFALFPKLTIALLLCHLSHRMKRIVAGLTAHLAHFKRFSLSFSLSVSNIRSLLMTNYDFIFQEWTLKKRKKNKLQQTIQMCLLSRNYRSKWNE